MTTREELDQKSQTLVEHLGELRTCLVRSLWALVVTTSIAYYFSEEIFNFVRTPIAPYLQGGGLIFTGPMDKFVAHLKLSIVCGVIFSCPFWLYQVWRFIAPGLYAKERKYMAGFIFSGTALFLFGVSFAYFIALPMAFDFLMHFGGTTDKPMISIDQYMGFFAQMCLMFGLAFEVPLIIVVLGMLGLVSAGFLRKNRRYAVMILAVFSAIVTPPDVLSMVMMLAPMLVLFEASVLIVSFFENKRRQAVNERE